MRNGQPLSGVFRARVLFLLEDTKREKKAAIPAVVVVVGVVVVVF